LKSYVFRKGYEDMNHNFSIRACAIVLLICLHSAVAAPGLRANFYALPNAGFIQTESGDGEVILEDFSGSIATLQAAINQARSDYPEAFLLIRLKPGALYSVAASPLVLGSKMCLTGNATRLEAAGTSVAASTLLRIAPGSSYVSISNVILNGRLATVRGIEAAGVARVNIDNTIVRNTGLAGIFLQGPGSEIFDSQLSVANCDVSGSTGSVGIHLKDATQAVCIENTSSANGVGLLLDGVSRSTVANNRCIGNSGSGISLGTNSTATHVFNNLVSGSPVAISMDASTVRNTIASNDIRSATTGIALAGVVHTLYDNVFPSAVTTPVQTLSSNHHIITTSTGFSTTGQNYFYPPTVLNNHSATVIAGKSNTIVATAAPTFSQIQAAYDAARAANPANTIILRLTAPVIAGDTTLTLSSSTCVVISGRVNLAPGVTGFASTNSTFVSISGGIIDGGNTTGRHGIKFAGCYRVLIDRMTIQNFGDKNTRANDSDLIWFSKGGSPCIVAHCTLNGGAARGIWTLDATARFLFTDNTISNVNMDGIDLDAFTNSSLVKFNSVSGCVRNGIFVEEGAKHNQVVGNLLMSNPVAINLYAYYIEQTSYNSIIANTCTLNARGIRVGARTSMTSEHNLIFANRITQTGPQSALDAQLFGVENYFSQNHLLNNADDIGSSSAVFFNSPALGMPAQPVVISTSFNGAVGFAFSGRIDASGLPTRFTRASGTMPQGLALNSVTGQISGTPMQSGNYLIAITATNLRGTSSSQPIPITITANLSKAKPVVTSAASVNANVARAFTHQITATNLPTFYSATGLAAGLSINATTGLISGTPPSEGTFATRIFATNPGGTGNQTLTFTIAPTLPVITSPANAAGHAGSPFRYRIVASNYPRTFGATGLPSGLSVNSTSGLISGTPAAIGNATVMLSAANGAGTATKILQLAIHRPPPVLTSNSSATGKVGDPLAHQLAATNNPVTFASSRLPSGLTLNATTGLISGKPGIDGSFAVQITATNPGGTGNQTLTFTIAPTLPVITSLESAIATVGAAFTYSITASNRPRTYAASGLPTDLTVNATTGLISGIPTAAGNATVTLSAANGAGTATKILQLAIRPQPPAITSAASASARVGVSFSYQITASNSPTRFSASGLPSGLTLNATTGRVSGSPATAGSFGTRIVAINAGGAGNQTVSIAVSNP